MIRLLRFVTLISDVILSAAMALNFFVHMLYERMLIQEAANRDPFERWADGEGSGPLRSLERGGDGMA